MDEFVSGMQAGRLALSQNDGKFSVVVDYPPHNSYKMVGKAYDANKPR